jgi:hypothetical protein
MADIFPIATNLITTQSTTDLVVFDEIKAIERAILVAANSGNREATINNTVMTTPLSPTSHAYWQTYNGDIVNRKYSSQIKTITDYFSLLKYTLAVQPVSLYNVTQASVNTTGSGYYPMDVLTVQVNNGIASTDATLTLLTTQISNLVGSLTPSWTINVPGINYAVNDIIYVSTGVYITQATYKVTSVGGVGNVTGLELLNAGEYSSNPSILGASSTTSGIGSGLILGLTMGAKNVAIANNGSYGKLPTNPVSVTSAHGTGATFNLVGSLSTNATFQWFVQW